jgi:hypothetical protein
MALVKNIQQNEYITILISIIQGINKSPISFITQQKLILFTVLRCKIKNLRKLSAFAKFSSGTN